MHSGPQTPDEQYGFLLLDDIRQLDLAGNRVSRGYDLEHNFDFEQVKAPSYPVISGPERTGGPNRFDQDFTVPGFGTFKEVTVATRIGPSLYRMDLEWTYSGRHLAGVKLISAKIFRSRKVIVSIISSRDSCTTATILVKLLTTWARTSLKMQVPPLLACLSRPRTVFTDRGFPLREVVTIRKQACALRRLPSISIESCTNFQTPCSLDISWIPTSINGSRLRMDSR